MTYRFFSHIVNAVGTAVVVTCQKLRGECVIEIGLCVGDERCISLDDRPGFVLRKARVIVSLDEGDGDCHSKKYRAPMHFCHFAQQQIMMQNPIMRV